MSIIFSQLAFFVFSLHLLLFCALVLGVIALGQAGSVGDALPLAGIMFFCLNYTSKSKNESICVLFLCLFIQKLDDRPLPFMERHDAFLLSEFIQFCAQRLVHPIHCFFVLFVR